MSQYVNVTLPLGLAGTVTRGFFDHTVESYANNSSSPVKEFGVAVAQGSDGTVSASGTGVIGFAVRNYTQVDSAGSFTADVVGVLRRGYLLVKVTAGTAKAGGKVDATAAGAISATAESNTEIAGAVFMGAADANGIAEVSFNI